MRGLPNISALQSLGDVARGRRGALLERKERINTEILNLEDEEEECNLTSELFRKLIDKEVTEGVQAVESLLTEGLQTVFDDQDLRVTAKVDTQRGKVSVDLFTVQVHPNQRKTTGLSREAFGGAVTTVQSVLLRIIVALRRELRPLFLMDETMPAFDGNYVTNMGNFLRLLCERLGLDILLVTHDPGLMETATRAYLIALRDGAASFTKVR